MKVLYNILLCLCFTMPLAGQNGLERIIVEKYYVSSIADKAVDGEGGELPDSSVTYRVFIDMLPGYIFQAAFGTPEHQLRIGTTTRFFNNEDRGAGFPTYSRSQAQNNTVMLDSWLSVGAGMRDHAGLLKEMDNGVNTIDNADGVLLNTHIQAGIPLTEEDGVISATTEPVTVVGFFDTDLSIFEDANDAPMPAAVVTNDGAWSSLNGSMGPDSTENIVLIGQFTTNGIFDFELNLQIRNQQTLGVETYVARNPVDDEILFNGLIHRDSLELETSAHDAIPSNDMITLYPNPTSDKLYISLDEVPSSLHAASYTLHGIDGCVMFAGKVSERVTMIDITHLLTGTYLLSVESNGMRYTEKVILQR